MRAREFIVQEQVAAALPAALPAAKEMGKNWLKGAGTAVDKYYNVQGYGTGANLNLPDPVGQGVQRALGQEVTPPKNMSAAEFAKDQAQFNIAGRALQGTSNVASKVPLAKTLAPAAKWAGTALRTGTGPVGTGAALALRSGDAGSAYGPDSDTRTGREEWMQKHGYDPKDPKAWQQSSKDYKAAQDAYAKLPLSTRLNQKLNPWADDESANPDTVMKYNPNKPSPTK
jgi:hypothetical protein